MRLHELGAVLELVLSAGNGLAVQQLNEDGDVRGLDEIENVFPREVENSAHNAEAAQAAPEGAGGGRIRVCAQISKSEPDHRAATGRHEIRNSNT